MAFRELAARHPQRVFLVDAGGNPEVVFERLWPLVEEVLV